MDRSRSVRSPGLGSVASVRIINSAGGDDTVDPSRGTEVGDGAAHAADGEVLTATPASLLTGVDATALMTELVDRLLGGPQRYTAHEIAEAAGVERDMSHRLWRAMGLADVPDDEVGFTELDLEALQRTKSLLGRGDIQMELVVRLARVLGLATARIADSVVEFTLERLIADYGDVARPSPDGHLSPETHSSGEAHHAGEPGVDGKPADLPLVSLLLGELDGLIIYLLHRHLIDATARRLATVVEGEDGTSVQLAVGFADLVGFTALSQQLGDAAIVELIERFETLSSNEVVGAGGRIIKMIGDEVMFSSSEEAGPEIALRLAETFTDPELPSVRVGLASGAVLSRSGDLFGPVVNLAARATAIAHPGTVVVSPNVRDRLVDDERFQLRRMRPRQLKGIGVVELSVLRRSKSP